MDSANAKLISQIGGIKEVKRVTLPTRIKACLNEENVRTAERNGRKIFAYKVVYRSRGCNVVGYIVEPRKGSNLPCVIWNRGGSGEFGAIKTGQLFLGGIAELAKAGYIVIASQYAGNGGGEGVESWGGEDVQDVLNLRKVLKAYSRADVAQVGMYGENRGGMMTYLCLKNVRWIRAAVTVAGVADLFRNAEERPQMYEHVFKKYFGGTKKEMRERSALYWPEKLAKKTLLLMMHGTADWRVSPLDSIQLAEKLYKHKVPYRLIVYEGAAHGLPEYKGEKISQTIAWFDRFLKNNEKLPDLSSHGKRRNIQRFQNKI